MGCNSCVLGGACPLVISWIAKSEEVLWPSLLKVKKWREEYQILLSNGSGRTNWVGDETSWVRDKTNLVRDETNWVRYKMNWVREGWTHPKWKRVDHWWTGQQPTDGPADREEVGKHAAQGVLGFFIVNWRQSNSYLSPDGFRGAFIWKYCRPSLPTRARVREGERVRMGMDFGNHAIWGEESLRSRDWLVANNGLLELGGNSSYEAIVRLSEVEGAKNVIVLRSGGMKLRNWNGEGNISCSMLRQRQHVWCSEDFEEGIQTK